jgi:ligand-binding sensor domain-containing protein
MRLRVAVTAESLIPTMLGFEPEKLRRKIYRVMKTVLSVACFFILAPSALPAQPREAVFKRYGAAEGLPSSHISCLLQDHRGFLWVGTGNGLHRFDGYTFKAFKRDPADTTSISDNLIRSLYEDEFHTLWVGTSNGLNAFDHYTEKFTHYYNVTDSEVAAANFVSALWGDGRGTIWVATLGGGAYRFDISARAFTHVELQPLRPSKPDDLRASSILAGSDGTIWIGTLQKGLLRFDSMAGTTAQYLHDAAQPQSLGSDNILALCQDHHGTIWVGAHKGGFARMSQDGNHLTPIWLAGADEVGLNTIGSIVEDPEGILWLGTSGAGLLAYDPDTGDYEVFKSDPRHPQTLSHDWIVSQYVDRAGNLWIGTISGLNRLQTSKKKIKPIRNMLDDPNRLIHNHVNAFWQDREGILWVGTAGGLSVFDGQSRLIANYTNDPNNENSLSLNFVQAIREHKNGDIWAGTFGGGLNKFNRKSRTFTRFRTNPSDTSSLTQDFVTFICEDHIGDLWVGTLGGLNRCERGRNCFQRFRSRPNNPKALSHNGITYIFEDRLNRLWLGTYGGGLNQWQRASGEFRHYRSDRANPKALSDDIVNCIFEDQRGILWIGTNGGLNKFDPATEVFSHYLEQDGLCQNSVLGILGDAEGNLWISTNNGLCRFDDRLPPGQKFVNFEAVKDGLQANEFNTGAFHRSQSGELFFGGPNGFNRFYPPELDAKSQPPTMVITAFNRFNKSVDFDTAFSAMKQLELSHKDDFFSFEFAALDFTLPEKNEYAYRMEGFNSDWIYSGNQHQATFTNLDPGTYTFRVKGANSDGVWNEQGAWLRVRVSPPFWQTWWFRLATGAGFFLFIYGLYRLRLNKAIEIERLRVRIASDLHDDIGANLTKISLYSDLIRTGTDPSTSQDLLQKIGAMSRDLMTTMSDIVWSIDARNDTVGDLVDRMHDFASGACSAQQIAVQFHATGLNSAKKLSTEVRQNLYLIFKEAVINAVKHAAAAKLYVTVQNINSVFKMEIKDDGRGFRETPFRRGHGLRNMKMRAARVGAKLEFKTDAGVAVIFEGKAI